MSLAASTEQAQRPHRVLAERAIAEAGLDPIEDGTWDTIVRSPDAFDKLPNSVQQSISRGRCFAPANPETEEKNIGDTPEDEPLLDQNPNSVPDTAANYATHDGAIHDSVDGTDLEAQAPAREPMEWENTGLCTSAGIVIVCILFGVVAILCILLFIVIFVYLAAWTVGEISGLFHGSAAKVPSEQATIESIVQSIGDRVLETLNLKEIVREEVEKVLNH